MTLAVKQCSIWSEGRRQRQRDRHREGERQTQREHDLSCEAVQHLVHGAHVDVLVDALHAHRLGLELNAVFDNPLGRPSVHA